VQAIDIDLWFWSLEADPAVVASCAALLSPDEAARAARFVKPELGRAFTVGRGRMRQILGVEIGKRPDELVFATVANGKPVLDGGPQFNLTHSGGWAGLAVSHAADIGLDLETWRPVEQGVAERFFSRREAANIRALSGNDWRDAFFRVWTRKEAVIKALGTGLSHDLGSFDVTLDAGDARIERIVGDTASDWTLIDLNPPPGFAAALALRSGGRPVRLRYREGALPAHRV
jgi:4'-phosphopantetheinyl transferase